MNPKQVSGPPESEIAAKLREAGLKGHTIHTKYSIGEVVYITNDGAVIKDTITSVAIRVYKNGEIVICYFLSRGPERGEHQIYVKSEDAFAAAEKEVY